MPKKKLPDLVPLHLSAEKVQELKKELQNIEEIQLPAIRKRMALAYEDGDIPENNPFITANDDLQEAMKRRNDLRGMLARAKLHVQSPKRKSDQAYIQLGDTITIEAFNKKMKITLVSSEEANPMENKISIDSPLGKALIGNQKGETVNFDTPDGTQTVKILQ